MNLLKVRRVLSAVVLSGLVISVTPCIRAKRLYPLSAFFNASSNVEKEPQQLHLQRVAQRIKAVSRLVAVKV